MINVDYKELLIDYASAALSELATGAVEAVVESAAVIAVGNAAVAGSIAIIGAGARKFICRSKKGEGLSKLVDVCIQIVQNDGVGEIAEWCKPQILDILQQTELEAYALINNPRYIADLSAQAERHFGGDEAKIVSRICSLAWSSLAMAIRKSDEYCRVLEISFQEQGNNINAIKNDVDSLWKNVDKILVELNLFKDKIENNKQNPNYPISFARIIDNIRPAKDREIPFHYRNHILHFIGREKELQKLQDFLDDSRDLLWMSVTGDGGSGKSKLLYHFCEILENQPAWKSVWLTDTLMRSIIACKNGNEWEYPCNLLFIVDYAATIADDVGKWMKALSETIAHPEKVRFIILERENAGSGNQEITPIWYTSLMGDVRQSHCLKDLHYEDIKLSGLSEKEYSDIIREFAICEHQKTLSNYSIRTIIELSRNIDSHNKPPRILLVLLTADAYIRDSDLSNWNVEELIASIVDRYKDHWRTVIEKCSYPQGIDVVMNALIDMLLYATATDGWNPENEDIPPENPFAESANIISNLRNRSTIFAMLNNETDETESLNPLEPDLIGECFSLKVLYEYYNGNKGLFEKILKSLWNTSFSFTFFIDRCIQNYYENEQFMTVIDQGIMLKQIQKNLQYDYLYSQLMVNISIYQPESKAVMTINVLKDLADAYPDNEEFLVEYAKGLVNISSKQDEKKTLVTANLLKGLADKHSDNEEIVEKYARGLYNLSVVQQADGAMVTIKTLKCLVDKYPDNKDILANYIRGLGALSGKQSAGKAMETLKRIKKYADSYPEEKGILVLYAQGLASLINNQQVGRATKTIKMFGKIVDENPDNEHIVGAFAIGLLNLSSKQTPKEAAMTIKKLKSLSDAYPNNNLVQMAYTMSSFNPSL